MKTINGIEYKSQREFIAALIKTGNKVERYRIAGRENLTFYTKREAAEFYKSAGK